MQTIHYIDTEAKLERVCREVIEQPWIAIDTEFLRERTYYPKLCLIQFATPGYVALIDMIKLPSLQKFDKVLDNPEIVKVFHSCRQDLEVLFNFTGKLPQPIFDTQLAAPLLGFQENAGYGMLVSSLLKINLSKAHTRTDWSQRPLSEEQLQYAADDVIYLCEIYQIIHQQLVELNRLDWLQDDFSALLNTELYRMPPENAWLKVKGKNKLSGKQLAILQAIAHWRENVAKAENRPKNWVIRDDVLLELARLQPSSIKELSKVHGLHERAGKRYGSQLSSLIAEAKNSAPVKRTETTRSVNKTPQQEATLDVLAAVVRIRADENMLNPAILATRHDLEKLLFKRSGCRLLSGWRYKMVGSELSSILQGQRSLILNSGELSISEINNN